MNRARNFFNELIEIINSNLNLGFQSKKSKLRYNRISFKDILKNPENIYFQNPMDNLPIARNKDFGGYQKRREELLKKGEDWFNKISTKVWLKNQWIKEIDYPNITVNFAERKEIEITENYCSIYTKKTLSKN